MALQKIFLEKSANKEPVGTSKSTTYSFEPNQKRLCIFWKGKKVHQCKAYVGGAFTVDCCGNNPKVHKIKWPKKNADVVMWLLDFSKSARAYSLEEFEKVLRSQRAYYKWWEYEEKEWEGDKYKFIISNRPNGGINHVAAYVDDNISKEDVLEMLKYYKELRGVFPEYFVKKVLKDRFNISKQEVDKLKIFS